MPELSRFYGISIRMYYGDHAPPHFHARYGSAEAMIDLATADLIEGQLPSRAFGLIMEWAKLHRAELIEAWDRASRNEPPGRIAPLP